eukprot:TRINITY_DN8350_c0_g1_i1.p1 TRINITY_DN8350_c0_g1~~TRINITY_DN8350_c0_g1_i1.p1  ORF type:complete len:445 (+),score=124.62 TRINITY_DN8350_c0_g1_i1:164-1498(+)
MEEFTISKTREFRIILKVGEVVKLKLLAGEAHSNARPLPLDIDIEIDHSIHQVFPITSVTDESRIVISRSDGRHTRVESEDNAKASLERDACGCFFNRLRQEASEEKECGPRILVVGADSKGKSSFCNAMAAYAVQKLFAPIYFDMNLHVNELCVPGCVGATVLWPEVVSLERGVCGDSLIRVVGPTDIKDDPDSVEWYKQVIDLMAADFNDKVKDNALIRASGFICDFVCVKDMGRSATELLKHCIKQLGITHVMNMDTWQNIMSDFDSSSSGTCCKDVAFMTPKASLTPSKMWSASEWRQSISIYNHFYGWKVSTNHVVAPVSRSFPAKELTFCQIVKTTSRFNPLSEDGEDSSSFEAQARSPSKEIEGRVVAFMGAEGQDESAGAKVLCFGLIRSMFEREEDTMVELLLPHGGEIPSKFLIVLSVSWEEQRLLDTIAENAS